MQLSAHVLVWNVCVEFQSLEAEGHRIVPIIFFRGEIFSAWKRAQTCVHVSSY